MSDPSTVSVCVIGAGTAGLITAHTLIKDGFQNTSVFTRDSTVGGVWAAERAYPGVAINNVYGEYRFSPLPMPPPSNAEKTGGRLSGDELCPYFDAFADHFLKGKIQFNKEVQIICRDDKSGWKCVVQDLKTREKSTLHFDKIVLCSGSNSVPNISASLSPAAAKRVNFDGPVIHSIDFASNTSTLLDAVKPTSDPNPGHAVVIGGGKSAQDIASFYARNNRKVSVIFDTAHAFLATATPLPDFIRKSRLLSMMSPYMELRTWQERFLHTTWLGSLLTSYFWSMMTSDSFKVYDIPASSPLRNSQKMFWTIHLSDEGVWDPTRFHGLVSQGKIDLVAPTHATGYAKADLDPSGSSSVNVETTDGRSLKANAVVVCTGYEESWSHLFDDATRDKLGLNLEPIPPVDDTVSHYRTLANPPPLRHPAEPKRIPLYRGVVPPKNILRRDFALNGTVYTANFTYTCELQAHWISSYFLEDPFLKIPESPEEARKVCDRHNMWWRKRFPDMITGVNQTISGGFPYLNWPQAGDSILEDMGLRSMRSGGNWLTWPFKVSDSSKEIEHLHEERAKKRLEVGSGY